MPFVNFSREHIDKLNKLIGGNLEIVEEFRGPRLPPPIIPQQHLFHAVALTDIEAAGPGAPELDATSFEFRLLVPETPPISPGIGPWMPGDNLTEDPAVSAGGLLGLDERVGWNRDPNFSLPALSYFVIGRYGAEWRPVVGGGGSSGIWMVEILNIHENCDCIRAECEVRRRPEGDTRWTCRDRITVYDDLGCVLNAVAADLERNTTTNQRGAHALVFRSVGDCYGYGYQEQLPPYCEYGYADIPEPHFTFLRRCCARDIT